MDSNMLFSGSPFTQANTPTVSANGFPTISFQIVGTFTSGSYTPQVSNDGETWISMSAISIANALVSSVTLVGMYRADVNGYQCFRLSPTSVVGTLAIYIVGSAVPLTYQGA